MKKIFSLSLLLSSMILFSQKTYSENTGSTLESLSMSLGELKSLEHFLKASSEAEAELVRAIQKARTKNDLSHFEPYKTTRAGRHIMPVLQSFLRDKFHTYDLPKHQHDIDKYFLFLHAILSEIEKRYTTNDIPTIVLLDTHQLAFEFLLVSALTQLGYKKTILHSLYTSYPDRINLDRRHFQQACNKKNITVTGIKNAWSNTGAEIHLGLWRSPLEFLQNIMSARQRNVDYAKPLIFIMIDPFPQKTKKLVQRKHDLHMFFIAATRAPHTSPTTMENSIDFSFKVPSEGRHAEEKRAEGRILIPSGKLYPLIKLPTKGSDEIRDILNRLFKSLYTGWHDLIQYQDELMSKADFTKPTEDLTVTFYDLFSLSGNSKGAIALELPRAIIKRPIKITTPPLTAKKLLTAPNITPYSEKQTDHTWYTWDKDQKKFIPIPLT